MDKNRMKKICQKALNTSYSGLTIENFEMVKTSNFDSVDGTWKSNSYALFIILKKPENLEMDYDYFRSHKTNRNVEEFLEMVVGYECCIGFL